MNGLYKEKGEVYFAAANSKDGFKNYFYEIFDKDCCDRVYILKGGPGVGKSTFIKKAGKLAEEKGFTCEYFLCSSDPSSLDGIVIKEKRTAIIDGTNPHAMEPELSGAREIIIDLGCAWDTDRLFDEKDNLYEITQKKKLCYNNCYRYLYSKNVIDGILYNLAFPYIMFDKLEKSAARLSKSLFKGIKQSKKTGPITRITNAISTHGKARLSTFEDMADFCIFIKEPYAQSRLAALYMSVIAEYAKTIDTKTVISYNPERCSSIDALYFPEIKTSVSIYTENLVAQCDRQAKKCRIINSARFLDMKGFSSLKPLKKFYLRLSDGIEAQALDALAEAGTQHAKLEQIYGKYTDYSVVEKIFEKYIKKIL